MTTKYQLINKPYLWAVIPLAERAAAWCRVCLCRGRELSLRFGLVLVWRWCFRVHRGGLGAVATCWRGIAALSGRRDFQWEGLAGTWGYAGCDGVPSQTTMHLIKVASHISFGSEGFEAHWTWLSSRCAECPRPTCGVMKRVIIANDNSCGKVKISFNIKKTNFL